MFANPSPSERAALVRYVAGLDRVEVSDGSDGSVTLHRPVRKRGEERSYASSITILPDGSVPVMGFERLAGGPLSRGSPMGGDTVTRSTLRVTEARVVDALPSEPDPDETIEPTA